MPVSDSLGDRMKGYEAISSHQLMRRCPVIVRVDGRAFHAWTRRTGRPFDGRIVSAMVAATAFTAGEMQGCRLAYTQSDEASFFLSDYETLETQPWFGYNLSKVLSIAASTFTAQFNAVFPPLGAGPATFDARAFNVPESEVANYFLWRAKDWRRNSIQMLAQHHSSPRDLNGMNTEMQLGMLADAGHDWNALPAQLRCGTFYAPRIETIFDCIEPNYQNVAALLETAMARAESRVESTEVGR